MSTAFVFAGQGAQYPGMGRDLCEKYSEARAVFDAAGADIEKLCFGGTPEELRDTMNTQPCVYTVTMAAYEAFRARMDVTPAAMAGFSLGEYSALTAAGYIGSIADGADIMRHRGLWMGQAGIGADGTPLGTMAAAIGDPDRVVQLVESCRGTGILTAANFNAPSQTVVSGDREAVSRFVAAAKEARLRVTPLAVSSAFHSEMMRPAAAQMREYLLTGGFAQQAAQCAAGQAQSGTGVPVYSNYTAEPVADYRCQGSAGAFGAEDFAELMSLQLMSSVQWVSTVQKLVAAGVDTFVEFGPGRTLSGLIRKTDKSVRTMHVEDSATLEEALAEIGGR